ncbi:MAG: thiamine-phosphate kinase [Candidatus Diapherotrites archaeon]|uniref:Thiamine-monophosphate kinase n=1 Tax=Candidatus Iainarchaeum sp. TaxID=3101447 RepID=A0A2D6M108_9ARCH|nr:thiamine-phosphate kinase [Candidatus Diapherotrites archaeon]
MRLNEIGEHNLIKRITRKAKNRNVLVGIGDDAAVIKTGKGKMVITVDTLVENDHFTLKWFTPKQVGMKAMEINTSDIGAMNAIPRYALVSLCLPKTTTLNFVDGLYKGIYSVADKYGIDIVGGNMTHGHEIVVDITMIGEAKGKIPLRSNARPGDYIISSGNLGASTAGLNLFLKKKSGFAAVKKKHVEPKAKLKKAYALAKYTNAMEDCSDGLASEVRNICAQSKCGAVIEWDKIPVSRETIKAAKAIGLESKNFALFGGEDFELIATVPKKHLSKVKGFVVGRITKEKKIYLKKNGKKEQLEKAGYDHFA